MQEVRQIGLLVSELLTNAVKVVTEVLKHIGVGTQLVSVHRRVARDAPGPLVVMNDHEIAWHFKEAIHAARNDHVDIQEQRGTTQAMQVLRKRGQLGPAPLRNTRGQIQRRNGQAFNFAPDA